MGKAEQAEKVESFNPGTVACDKTKSLIKQEISIRKDGIDGQLMKCKQKIICRNLPIVTHGSNSADPQLST